MPEILVFGRSPFINKVDVGRLLTVARKSIGINYVACDWPMDFLFYFDGVIENHKAGEAFGPHTLEGPHTKFVPRPVEWPIKHPMAQDGLPVIGFRYFTVSIALNWALLQGFKKAYLIGIDHKEDQHTFDHYDGSYDPAELTPDSHRRLKQFIADLAPELQVYQCNPEVAPDWDLPYKDLEELYEQKI